MRDYQGSHLGRNEPAQLELPGLWVPQKWQLQTPGLCRNLFGSFPPRRVKVPWIQQRILEKCKEKTSNTRPALSALSQPHGSYQEHFILQFQGEFLWFIVLVLF